MNDREAMICRLKELRYSNTYCTLDTLIRIDEDVQMLSCKHCIFQDIIIDDYMVYPLKIIGELLLLK